MTIKFSSFHEYFQGFHPHSLYYAWSGAGKTTFAGRTGLRTVLIDCGDAGVMTLRKSADPKKIKIVRVRTTSQYLEVIDEINRRADSIDLLVIDTLTGLQSLAIKQVKGKGEMNQRRWGQAGSMVIECISETRNFSKDLIYLSQEKRRLQTNDNGDEKLYIAPSLMPSVREYLSSSVDWVGRIFLQGGERKLSFILTEEIEAKDRSNLFPKILKLPASINGISPAYSAIRARIVKGLDNE